MRRMDRIKDIYGGEPPPVNINGEAKWETFTSCIAFLKRKCETIYLAQPFYGSIGNHHAAGAISMGCLA